MKMYKYFFATALSFLLSAFIIPNNSSAQGFNSITSSDGLNLVAVGNAGKMYRSVNGGVTWVNFNNGRH